MTRMTKAKSATPETMALAKSTKKKGYDHRDIEAKWQTFWANEGIYHYQADPSRPQFSVDTPPPYISSSSLHMGHAMSYSQAEFVVRYHRMKGDSVFYPMGFDDNGLPTEMFVERKYKINKRKVNRSEFIDLCLKETKEGTKTYEKLFRSLGISVDWSLRYSTINPHCRRIAQRSFIDLYRKGRIVRKNEPVMWCTKCRTALAQAEIDTVEQPSSLNYIQFTFEESGEPVLIATTRPELVPGCVAMYCHPNDPRYQAHIGKSIVVPLTGHTVKIKADEDVDMSYGSGFMMVCTWGDQEDVRRWKSDTLGTRSIINEYGKINELGGPLAGLSIENARARAIELLQESGALVKVEPITHMVGRHERCHTNMEFHMTPQWFIRILDRKDAFIARGRELAWYPAYYRTQYEHWVEGLKWDWCISRQRFYGVPFPVWYCSACEAPYLPDDKDLPVDPKIDFPDITQCPSCHCKAEWFPENDVMDTWMTSSLTPLINARWNGRSTPDSVYPMSVRVQAFEIIRTWLFYTVVKSHYHTDSLPFENVMISGWGLDKNGKKMSKTAGNLVEAQGVIDQYSADAVRYWAAGANLGTNLLYNEGEVKGGRRLCVKLLNAARLISGFFPKIDGCSDTDTIRTWQLTTLNLTPSDRWILSKLGKMLQKVTGYFEAYDFARAKSEVDRFFWVDLCDNYLEIVKERLYKPDVYGDNLKQSGVYVCYQVLDTVVKCFAPIVPHVTEEVYQTYLKGPNDPKSVHISRWPVVDERWHDPESERVGEMIIAITRKVRAIKSGHTKALGTPLSRLTISCPGEIEKLIRAAMLDIQNVTRAQAINFGDDATMPCDDFPIKLGIDF